MSLTPLPPCQARGVLDKIQLNTVDARAVGRAVLNIAAHLLVSSMERATASGATSPVPRALAVSNTSQWVMATVDRVRVAVSETLLPGAPTSVLAVVDRLTGRSTSVSPAQGDRRGREAQVCVRAWRPHLQCAGAPQGSWSKSIGYLTRHCTGA